jgi:GT2 family glycosyltransferase
LDKIKHRFDESFGKFHFYDHGFCLPNYISGVKIGVTSSFEITHKSIGVPNDEFFKTKEFFVEKYKDILPLDLKPNSIYFENIKTKISKKIGLTAVIILTKSKNNLLFNCINSFIQNCDASIYEIFIADTGSNEKEKNEIKNFIELKKETVKIHFIEYDYYNFAKINNDVVNNIIGDRFKFILFCNNDIRLLNDVLGGMLDIFCKKNKVGTVGCRLHYENNLVQHDGVASSVIKNQFYVTHHGLSTYYYYLPYIKNVSGNTAALMMIRLKTFNKCGGFNENYISCFEDLELNYVCIVKGLNNYNDGRLVAYHYESQTRNEDQEKQNKMTKDYNTLLSFVRSNFDKIKNVFRFYE